MLLPTGLYLTVTFGYFLLNAAMTAPNDFASAPVQIPSNEMEPFRALTCDAFACELVVAPARPAASRASAAAGGAAPRGPRGGSRGPPSSPRNPAGAGGADIGGASCATCASPTLGFLPPFWRVSVASPMFMEGLPMKPPTKRLTGLS